MKEVSYLGDIKTNLLFVKTGSETVRAYSGHLDVGEILKIWRSFPVEGLGLYFGKHFVDKHGKKEARLSLDGLHFVRKQVNKNIIELNDEQVVKWFKGDNLELTKEQKETYQYIGFVAVKYKEDLVGTGKNTPQGILLNFLPKERRIRN